MEHEPTTYVVREKDGTVHEPVFHEGFVYLVCPKCGNADPGLWADDGESDLADYMDCKVCGLDAALVLRDDVNRTQNGLPWPPA